MHTKLNIKTNTKQNEFINSQQFLMDMVKKIEQMIKRDLLYSEEDILINCINQVPTRILKTNSAGQIEKMILDTVISEIYREHQSNNEIDTHEMLKKNLGKTIADNDADDKDKDNANNTDVNVETFFGIKDVSTLIKKMKEPISSVNTAYFLLDTRYRVLENDGKKYFKWCHMNNITTSQGTFNSIGDIRDIISIKLMQYRIPNVPSANTPYNRISVLIHELSAQAFMAHENVRYHFLGCSDEKNKSLDWIEVKTSDFYHGEYKFNKPITTLNTITISLGSPLEPIIFEPDRGEGIIEFTQSMAPTLTTITFPIDVKLKVDDIIYITNYTTVKPESYAVLNILNEPMGLPIISTTGTSITIAVDTSSLNKQTLSGTVETVFNSNTLNGIATEFNSELNVGDRIFINNSSTAYFVKSIISKTELIMDIPCKLNNTTPVEIVKNNIYTNKINVYFGSRRIFFTLEAVYLSS